MAILKVTPNGWNEEYVVDTSRQMEPYEAGDIICYKHIAFDIPLQLEIAIAQDGRLKFRAWRWILGYNGYLHTNEHLKSSPTDVLGIELTDQQRDTVAGLLSKRITFEGITLAPGASLQDICPIDLAKEEAKVGHTIYIA